MSPRPRFRDPRAIGFAALAALLVLLLLPSPAVSQGHGEPPAEGSSSMHERMEETHREMHKEKHKETDRGRSMHDGRCVSDCDCPPGKLCSPQTARCETAFCPQVFQPVCGLDGKTYPNRCRADAEHVVVAHQGECEDGYGGSGSGEPGEPCGGIAGIRCPEGQTCELPAGQCRGRDLQGECVPRPEMCPEVYDPVCACDGNTYSNDCFRRRAGVQKAHDGKCRPGDGGGDGDGKPPICASNADCAGDAYCDFPGGLCEGRGRCEPRPDVCTKQYDPVCGCNGKTYGNACNAASAGVSVARKGRCEA